MTTAERNDLIQKLTEVAKKNGYDPTITATMDARLFDPEFAKKIWPTKWRTHQHTVLTFIQEYDADGALRFILQTIE